MDTNTPKNHRRNTLLTCTSLIGDIVRSTTESVGLLTRSILGRPTRPLRENSFLDLLHFIVYTGPKAFWRKPTGIKMGRSLATLLHYIFHRDRHFHEIPPHSKRP